jgi:hypothetical protein
MIPSIFKIIIVGKEMFRWSIIILVAVVGYEPTPPYVKKSHIYIPEGALGGSLTRTDRDIFRQITKLQPKAYFGALSIVSQKILNMQFKMVFTCLRLLFF